MVNVYYLYLSHPGPSSWSKEAMGPAEASGLWVEVSAHCPLCAKRVLGWEKGALGSCPGSSHSLFWVEFLWLFIHRLGSPSGLHSSLGNAQIGQEGKKGMGWVLGQLLRACGEARDRHTLSREGAEELHLSMSHLDWEEKGGFS